MTTEDALQKAETLLQPITTELTRPAPNRLDAVIAANQLPAAARTLLSARWGYLAAITGLDHAAPAPKAGEAAAEGRLEALYHFCEGDAVTTLRITLPYERATIPTVCHLIPSATLFERELAEMFGITVAGTPDPDHLVLPDDWPEGVYPLRKSFTGKTEAVAPAASTTT